MKTTTRTALTPSQMMIWMGQKLNPIAPLYNMILTFEINGKIDVSCFQKAFQKLINHNDVLRSVIQTTNEVPFQEFYKDFESPLLFFDYSNNGNGYQEYKLWVEKNKGKLFDLSTTLYETVLFKITDDKFIWYLNQHHLITDGGAIKFVYAVMNENYQQFISNIAPVESSQNTYESYAYKNSYTEDASISKYWAQKLEKTESNLSLYGIKLQNSSSQSTRISIDLGYERTQVLKSLTSDVNIKAWTTEIALSNIFLTIISVLLFKIGDQENFAIGVPHQNRSSKKEKQTAGLFMQLLPLAVTVDSNDRLIDVFQKVKNESLEVMKNALISKPPSSLLKTFNVVMNFIPMTLGDFAGFSVESDWLLADHVDAHHAIRLQIQDFDNRGNYKLQFDLNNQVFSLRQRQIITQHFIKIIDAFITNKEIKLNKLSLITEAEVAQIKLWNNTNVLFDESETLLDKFNNQAAIKPNETAILFKDQKYSYIELNEKANQVAHFLIQKGVKSNDIIAISFDRSFEMMVYIYGILKAGAAYLPIDTTTPDKRLRFIAEDASFKILLFNHDHIRQEYLTDIECFHVNQIESEVLKQQRSSTGVKIAPENLAYVIYTSGSTGEPKGVKMPHKGICNRLNWMNRDYPIKEIDTLIQKTPITFDVSLWELFWPLQVGAKLVIEIPDGHKDPDQLIKTIRKNKVSVIHFVPAMLDVFLATSNIENCDSIKRIFCSGEALTARTVKQTYAKLSSVDIYNLYGPTEAAVDVTSWHCAKNELDNAIPIGFPVANTKIHIVDKNLNLVPIGMKGELCIGGVQVADGYLNREALNREKFIDDIFSESVGGKLYKTGDIARYRSNGAIEYIGRVDNQIKLRGVRIELGEIENIIEKYSCVSQVVVIVNQNENLVAFYTGERIEEQQLKNILLQWLPEYMIPNHFKNVKDFPLTQSGKVDKASLAVLDISTLENTTPMVQPHGEIEELIAHIWKEVLQLENISVHDNFISLGGHSLAAIRVTARVNEEIEMKFPLNKVFELPTIATYSGYVEETLIGILNEQI